jgi:hypothetical protein
MLRFYKDEQLTRPVTPGNPVWVFAPVAGAVRRFSLWLADLEEGLTYSGSLTITPTGPVPMALKRTDQTRYGVAGGALLYAPMNASSGSVPLARVDIELSLEAGADAEIDGALLSTSLLDVGEAQASADAALRVIRADQGAALRFRLYPASRKVDSNLPAFRFGEYRWRDRTEANAVPLAPTRWDLDVNEIGREKFIAGIAGGGDLEPVGLEKQSHAIRARIRTGTYFTGPDRYFLAGDGYRREFFSTSARRFVLAARPRPQSPLFVGCLGVDAEGYYDVRVRYEYMVGGFAADGPEYQFTLDRATGTVELNKEISSERMLLGVAPESDQAVFDLPVWPAGHVRQVLLGAYGEQPEETVSRSEVNLEDASVTVWFADAAAAAGRELYIDCDPAVAVCYEADDTAPDVVVPVDLNPAFAGIAKGYLYLEHRRRRTRLIELSCDKPRILTPQEYAMVSGLISFGPVSYENDFALLQASAYSERSGERVPGATLEIVTGSSFRGLINYRDPAQEAVSMRTGGDGTAVFIYTPPDAFGSYVPPASLSGSDLSLPEPVPIQLLWNEDSGWLARLYAVYNDDPFFGKVNAVAEYGEIPWQTSGTPGAAGYRTNGRRELVLNGAAPLLPSEAYDAAGKGHAEAGFDGDVVRLAFAAAPPVAGNIGAYFLTYVGRVTLQVRDAGSGVLSNVILLDLATPPVIVDESGVAGYLKPNGGRLAVNRLGGAPILPVNVNTSRY